MDEYAISLLLSDFWFCLLLFFVALVINAAIAHFFGRAAARKGRKYWSFFWLSLVLPWPITALTVSSLAPSTEKVQASFSQKVSFKKVAISAFAALLVLISLMFVRAVNVFNLQLFFGSHQSYNPPKFQGSGNLTDGDMSYGEMTSAEVSEGFRITSSRPQIAFKWVEKSSDSCLPTSCKTVIAVPLVDCPKIEIKGDICTGEGPCGEYGLSKFTKYSSPTNGTSFFTSHQKVAIRVEPVYGTSIGDSAEFWDVRKASCIF